MRLMHKEVFTLMDQPLRNLFDKASSQKWRGYLLADLSVDRRAQSLLFPVYQRGASDSLFRTTPEEVFPFIAPHLVPVESLAFNEWKMVLQQESEIPAFSWLWSKDGDTDLMDHLRKQLNMQLTDGGLALLRYYDPRVLERLMRSLNESQIAELMGPIQCWSLLSPGTRQTFYAKELRND